MGQQHLKPETFQRALRPPFLALVPRLSSSSESKPDTERADDREVERRSPSEGMEAASESLASSGTIKSSSSLVGLRFLSE
jgi:hypothetical protein